MAGGSKAFPIVGTDGARSWTVLGHDGVWAPADEFLAQATYAGRAANTVRAYAHDLTLWLRFLESRRLDWVEVGLDDLARFLGWLQLPADRDDVVVAISPPPQRSVATVNRALTTVFAFYDYHLHSGARLSEQLRDYHGMARRRGRVHAASRGRHRPITVRTEDRLPRAVERPDVVLLFAACQLLRDRLLLALWWGVGMRVGQTLGLRHEDVDVRRRQIRVLRRDNVNGAWAKNRREWIVPISDEIVRLHRDYMFTEYGDIDSDFVFVVLSGKTRGAALTPDAVAKLADRLRTRSGVQFTPHRLRHSFGTDFVNEGGRLEALSELMTHSSTSSTRRYTRLSVETLRSELVERSLRP